MNPCGYAGNMDDSAEFAHISLDNAAALPTYPQGGDDESFEKKRKENSAKKLADEEGDALN